MNGLQRWIRFNAVGLLGFALQTTTLFVLVSATRVNPEAAVTLAVLAAVSHNFIWHEHVTWPRLPRHQRLQRWVRFHLSTGLVSLVVNVSGTALLTRGAGLPIVPANLLVVVLASAANFWVSDRWVFAGGSRERPRRLPCLADGRGR